MTLAAKIVNKWLKCNKTFPVPYNEGRGIFHYDVWSDKQYVSQTVKCFVDCTLRESRVVSKVINVTPQHRIGLFNGSFYCKQITDAGRLDETEYMSQIKQLRFNYTLFDINTLSVEEKQQIWETVYKEANNYPRNCYAAAPLGNLPFNHMIFGSLLGHVSPEKVNIEDTCYNLILSYAQAARKCKNVRDPKGDQ